MIFLFIFTSMLDFLLLIFYIFPTKVKQIYMICFFFGTLNSSYYLFLFVYIHFHFSHFKSYLFRQTNCHFYLIYTCQAASLTVVKIIKKVWCLYMGMFLILGYLFYFRYKSFENMNHLCTWAQLISLKNVLFFVFFFRNFIKGYIYCFYW